MPYVIIVQRWPRAATFYAQLERVEIDQPTRRLFSCLHYHRRHQRARACPEVLAARERDRAERRAAPSHQPE